jgi:2-polyprenyl-3-methyl-5-hydroxy-6-metoxy-1,4-benzoquinol methylase
VCDSSAISTIEEVASRRDFFNRALRLATCADCSARFQPFVPNTQELARWYDYMGHVEQLVTPTPLLERRLDRIVRTLEPLRSTVRVLEIGPGGGLFVKAAMRRGWEVHATEISPSCCQRLSPLLGPRLHQGEVLTAPFAKSSFDAVVMIEVIEHLIDPYEYLTKIFDLLRAGGGLFLTTPNFRGASGRVLGTEWRIVADEHLNYFDASTVDRLLRRAGFSSVSSKTSNLDRQSLRALARLKPATPAPVQRTLPPVARTAAGSRTATLKAAVADQLIEASNRVLASLRLGDTLRSLAVKT